MVKDKEASKYAPSGVAYRGCGRKPLQGGIFCCWHDPSAILDRADQVALDESVQAIREARKGEEFAVGAYLRSVRPIEFEDLLADIIARHQKAFK